VARRSRKGTGARARKKSGGGALLKGAIGRQQRGGPAVRTPHSVERAWGLAPIVSRSAAARLGSAALFRAGARRGRLTRGPRLAAGEGGRREARAEHGPA
jgi:hypothetical protein